MELKSLMTLSEIEETYGVRSDTIRSYITRGQVIPENKRVKIGEMWFIDRKFAEEKWARRRKMEEKR